MSNPFIQAAIKRRSQYALGKLQSADNEDIIRTINEAMLQAPAAFGKQPTRVVVLFDQHHDKLWSIVETQLKKIVPEVNFSPTAEKLANFRAAHGTILFFEDQQVIEELQKNIPLYAEHFPNWGLQAQGIALYCIWTALANDNIGASIQHYNPLIDNDVIAQWKIPPHWKLLGQMPFGDILSPARDKTMGDINMLVKIFR